MKKLIAALALSLVLGLAACGGGGSVAARSHVKSVSSIETLPEVTLPPPVVRSQSEVVQCAARVSGAVAVVLADQVLYHATYAQIQADLGRFGPNTKFGHMVHDNYYLAQETLRTYGLDAAQLEQSRLALESCS